MLCDCSRDTIREELCLALALSLQGVERSIIYLVAKRFPPESYLKS